MKTFQLKSVVTGLMATAMMVCFTITTQANPVQGSPTDTGKMAKMDKMGKDKMGKDKMSKGKMAKDKIGKDKMTKKDTASKM